MFVVAETVVLAVVVAVAVGRIAVTASEMVVVAEPPVKVVVAECSLALKCRACGSGNRDCV